MDSTSQDQIVDVSVCIPLCTNVLGNCRILSGEGEFPWCNGKSAELWHQVSEPEAQSSYYIHCQMNILGKVISPLIK